MRHLLRDVKFQKSWVIAIATLIALGSGMYSSFRSTYDSGIKSLDDADEELNSADITVTTMPMDDLSSDVKNISGISMVSSAFTTECYTFVNGRKVRGEVSSVQLGERVNNYRILEGRDLKDGDEIVVEKHYADMHNIKPGQEITLYIDGSAVKFVVCGTCFSPRHIYLISSDGWLEKDYGIFFVPERAIAQSVNTFYIKVSDKSKIDDIASNIKLFFTSRGINAVVKPTERTFNYKAFREDLNAMNSLANISTIVLLGISAFMLFAVLSRLIESRRREIGVLRAMGYSKWNIFSYFLLFSGIAVVIGVILSIPIGFLILSSIMNYFGVIVLGIPMQFITYKLNWVYVAYAAASASVFSLIGAFFPSYRAASYTPAEAMRTYIASKKGARIMSRSSLTPTRKLIFREIVGHKVRSISTVVVIALVLSFSLAFAVSMDSIEKGLIHRFDKNELWNIKIIFNTPQNRSVLNTLSRVENIEMVEPYTEYGAEISYRNKSTIIQLHEISEGTKMRLFPLAEGGREDLIISSDVAHRLGVSVGDKVKVYTPFRTNEREISGILQEFASSEGYILKDFTDFTGALVKVKTGGLEQVEKSLQSLSSIKSWVGKSELREGWLHLLNEYDAMMYIMDITSVTLVLVAIGVVTLISARERGWEFVILKAMGYSNSSILSCMLWGNLLLSFIGVLLGIPLGLQLANAFNATFENLLSPPPTVLIFATVYPRCLLVISASLLSVFFIIKFTLRRNISYNLRGIFQTM